jgi:hypothetical protein
VPAKSRQANNAQSARYQPRQLSPWAIERAMRKTRSEVEGLPAGFRYHDQRHNCC